MSSLAAWLAGEPDLHDRLVLIDNLCRALETFQAEQPAVRPALDPGHIEVAGNLQVTLAAAGLHEQGEQVPEYRAPELLAGSPYEPTADIYSVGVVCYEVLAGRHPFVVPTPLGSVEAAAGVPPTPLVELRRDVPHDLAEAVMPCLESDPEWRPKDLSYLAETARRARRVVPQERRIPGDRKPPAVPERRPAPALSGAAARSSSRTPLFAAAGLGLLLLVGGLWYLTRPAAAPSVPGPATRPATPAAAAPAAAEQPPPGVPPVVAEPRPANASVPEAVDPPVQPTPAPSAAAATPPPAVVPDVPPAVSTPAPVREAVRPTPAPPPRSEPPPDPARRDVTRPEARVEPPAPAPAPSGPPPALTALAPVRLRRGMTRLVDVHGTNLRAEHRPYILYKGREAADGVTAVGQQLVNPSLLKVMIKVAANAREGSYSLALADAQGNLSNPRTFEVGR